MTKKTWEWIVTLAAEILLFIKDILSGGKNDNGSGNPKA